MRKKTINSALPKETSHLNISAKTRSKGLNDKKTTIKQFIKERKEWEKGLHTSKTVIR